MKLFMIVTRDEYELPVAVSDSLTELAHMQNKSVLSMRSCFSRGRKPNRPDYKYYKHYGTVEVD